MKLRGAPTTAAARTMSEKQAQKFQARVALFEPEADEIKFAWVPRQDKGNAHTLLERLYKLIGVNCVEGVCMSDEITMYVDGDGAYNDNATRPNLLLQKHTGDAYGTVFGPVVLIKYSKTNGDRRVSITDKDIARLGEIAAEDCERTKQFLDMFDPEAIIDLTGSVPLKVAKET